MSSASGPRLVWLDFISATETLWAAEPIETTRGLRKLGWHVVLVLEGSFEQRSVRGVEVHCIPKPQLYFLGYFVFHFRFLRFLAREWGKADVILFRPSSAIWILPLRFIRPLTRSRFPLLVMDIRDLDPPGGNLKNRMRVLYGRFNCGLANRWADGQTTITQQMAELTGVPPQKLWGIWPSGVNLDHFAPARKTRIWPKSGEPVHLVYIGALLQVRNLILLCQAIEKANTDGMKFRLTLAGGGSAQEVLEELASQTEDRVRVLPPIAHELIPELLAETHVGATSLFSPYLELFQASSPIKLFEYMAAGLPVLAMRMPCHTDVVGDGQYAFWVEDADVSGMLVALRQIWKSKASLSRMGSEAASAASEWTWFAAAEKLHAALDYGLKKYQ